MLGGEFVEVDKAEADKADHFHMEEVGPQPSTRTPSSNPEQREFFIDNLLVRIH